HRRGGRALRRRPQGRQQRVALLRGTRLHPDGEGLDPRRLPHLRGRAGRVHGAPGRALKVLRLVAAAAVLFSIAAALYSAWAQGETYDDAEHLTYARALGA